MGKSGRHKQLNRQEKAKTKLKGVKKLLKAQNVVNPTLKVKRIVIREQLTHAEGEDAPTTKKLKTLQEISSALHHHNTNLRKDALGGLLEIVTEHGAVLRQNLDKILERVAALTSDLEGVIRKENLKVAEAIFERIEESDLQPYWNLLLSHLQCTLTHLSTPVRYSTLPFFHLLVQHFPNLVSSSKETILWNLLGLISSSSSSTSKTHLKIDVSGRKDEFQERLKVFALIQACLDINTNPESRNEEEEGKEIKFQDKTSGLIYSFGYSSDSSLSEILESSSSNQISKDEKNLFWPRFVSSCVSCLIATWIEVGPVSSYSSELTLASASSTPQMPRSSSLRSGGGKSRQRDFDTIGSDKKKLKKEDYKPEQFLNGNTNNNSTSRSTNLNGASIDVLKSLVNLMVKLVPSSGGQTSSELNDFINKNQGPDLKKYLFNHLPFISIQDSNKRTLTTTNLQLFLLAAQLRLMDKDLMERLQGLIDELIRGGTLEKEQCDLILLFLCCKRDSKDSSSLPTDFITCLLSSKDHRREICKFFYKVLRPDNQNEEEMSLVQSLDWDVVTDKLVNCFSRISTKWLNLLTHVALRGLAEVKGHLLKRMEWFQKELEPSSPVQLWNEALRLFWYADALKEFKEEFEEKLPKELQPSLKALAAIGYEIE